jgi:hypothetical protein
LSFEDIPSWIYSILIIPLAVVYQKHFSLKNKVTILETNQANYMKQIDDICQSNKALAEDVNRLIGRVDEHLRSSSS